MKIFLILFVLFFSSTLVADGISDFQIEGISIGDSLLEHMSENEIKKEIEANKYVYSHLSEKFGEVYLFKDFKKYDVLSFFVKPNDKNYKIYSIRGIVEIIENEKKCSKKQNDLKNEFILMFPNAELLEGTTNVRSDSSGKSILNEIRFRFNTGDFISINCINLDENYRKKNNMSEGFNIAIRTLEVFKWFRP